MPDVAPPSASLDAPPRRQLSRSPRPPVVHGRGRGRHRPRRTRRRHRDALERHAGTGLVRHDVARSTTTASTRRRQGRPPPRAQRLPGLPRRRVRARPAPRRQARRTSTSPRAPGRRTSGRSSATAASSGGASASRTSSSAAARSSRSPRSGATRRWKPRKRTRRATAIDDILIRSDNVFGEAHEDALRRDFTMNALFYDLDRRQVLDWCGGMQDLKRRTIHTIGDPMVRFREDPIRILRAIKFAARLDLGIAPDVYDAMVCDARGPREGRAPARLRGDPAPAARRRGPPVDVAPLGDGGDGGAPARAGRVPRRRGGHRAAARARFFRKMDAIDAMTTRARPAARRRGALDGAPQGAARRGVRGRARPRSTRRPSSSIPSSSASPCRGASPTACGASSRSCRASRRARAGRFARTELHGARARRARGRAARRRQGDRGRPEDARGRRAASAGVRRRRVRRRCTATCAGSASDAAPSKRASQAVPRKASPDRRHHSPRPPTAMKTGRPPGANTR